MATENKVYTAKARNVRYSPYKLRPLADVIRGKSADFALGWLSTYKTKRAIALRKVLESAIANAKHLDGVLVEDLRIKDLKIDQGPTYRYYKPGAMGRAVAQKKVFCHLSVTLQGVPNNNLKKEA